MRSSRLVILLAASVALTNCATKKSRENPSLMGRFYHNTTAYYNGYFNANVLLQGSELKLASDHRDNYNQILDVYDYVEVASPEAVAADLDKAIEKVSVVATLHRPSHWVDDCYLLVGKAQYLKHDYESSEETLVFLKEAYSPEAMEQRRKTVNRKARARAREEEREEKRKLQEKERKERQEQVEEQRKEKKEEAEKSRKERKRAAAKSAKERRKEADRKRKEREREAKARAKARKKGQKVAPKVKAPDVSGDTAQIREIPPEPALEALPPAVPETAEEAQPKDQEEEAKGKTKKKEDPKPENYFLKHRPAYAAGLLWLGRTYTERELYDDAQRAFAEAATHPTASDEVKREIPVAQAHLYLKRDMPASAVPYLDAAINLAAKKKAKARYAYILGQIYLEQDQYAQAVEAFRKVIKWRPAYEMEFNARLNLLLAEYRSGQSPLADARKDMQKFLKDEKNEEYKDRIYFALAGMDLEIGDTTAAIANLKEASRTNSGNLAQRVETHLTLANLFYDREEYVDAKVYYDLVIKDMPPTDARYARASRLSKNLTDIARNIEIITLQDSLLMIAGLSEKERVDLAEQIKADRLAKAKEAENQTQDADKQAGKNLAASQGPFGRTGGPGLGVASKSTFFAYDRKALDRGLKDFKSYWGDRVLEDHWRRSNRAASFQVEEAVAAEEAIETNLTNSELEEMFKDVPFTEEARLAAEEKIEEAMLTLGRLYRERLDNNDKTIEVLTELITRFPETKHELDAWYFLYLAHKDLGQIALAQKYYDLIIGKYAESTYARVLSDPSYLGESQEREKRLNEYYKSTYTDFTAGRYQAAWSKLSMVDTLFGKDNRLQPKFALLSAMTTGNLEGKDAYIDALKDLVAKYPNTDESTRAKEILRLLGDKSVAPKDLPNQQEAEGEFDLDPEGTHYVIINWSLQAVDLQAAQNAVNAFNREYFKAERLRLSSNIFLSVDVPLMVVRKFDNAKKAMDYYHLVQKYADEFIGGPKAALKVYPVTQQNYRVILKNRELAAYEAFFAANYQ